MISRLFSKPLLVILLFSMGLAACGGGGSSTSSGGEAESTAGSILVLGDSISNGFKTSVAYPNLLRQKTGYPVINQSITGGLAETVISPIRSLLSKHKPKYVVILVGTNNARHGDIQTAISAIAFAVRVSNEAGAIPVVGTVTPIYDNSFYDRRAGQLSSQISGLSNARIANTRGVINSKNLTVDGYHPNAEGQQRLANEFARFIN